ncbi:glycosyltransferase involved in cell wall biosynthesis [Haloferula luteola]|uniref:Glycosyltransferase involved in cell wall biosynthesis n=1 Tax=Haloferula luteola TaxID=595692 RepID=A0A840VDG4_9BACT|nr:glycosyltransferase family 4 protein [Haloferula luteola]MBB5351920.1 glycosyltransferase involved in cell wall biosynthesis [Haloferula luteola]
MKKPRVLIIAEAANPELTSVALIGHSLSEALGRVCDGHLVTEKRNEESLLKAGVAQDFFTAVDNPAQSVAFHIATALRGGKSLGWTIHSAMATLAYPLFERKVWSVFRERLMAGEFDVVHRITPLSPTSPSYLAKKLAKLGVPFLMGPINGGIPWPPGFDQVRMAEREWLGYVRDIYRFMPGLKATRRLASGLILASKHTYREVTEGDPALEVKSVWLPENAIDPARFPEIDQDPPSPIPGAPLKIAFLGRLVPYKGADMLLEAAAPWLREGKLELEIIGDGPQMGDLKGLVEREGLGNQVTFAGWVAHGEVRSHLAAARVFAFPSVREFGGGVVLEAMALGLAPVVLDYGGPAELVPEGCGVVVPIGERPQIIEGFRKALSQLAENPQEADAMGRRAQQHVRAHFTWDAKARQILGLYEKLIAGRSLSESRFDEIGPGNGWDEVGG